MSSRTSRIVRHAAVDPFDWGLDRDACATPSRSEDVREALPVIDPHAAAERDRQAFAAAYAQGEQAGFDAGSARADAMLRRLAETITELTELRGTLIRQTEQQVVQIALAIARRILQRETDTDRDLLATLARVALDRLGDGESVRIRLHPDDHTEVSGRHHFTCGGSPVAVDPDPSVPRGGCLIESPLGFIDAGVDAQLRVIHDALASEAATTARGGSRHAA